MAYTIPTLLDFKTRYSEFDGVDDALLGAVLDEAAGSVNTTWLERDFAPAIMLLAAHLLTLQDAIARAAGGGTQAGYAGPITKERVGQVETTYGGGESSKAAGSADGYAASEYGKRFERLMRLNFSGAMVA